MWIVIGVCGLLTIDSVGHKGKFGHEFMEFEFRPDGKLRYANNSNYKNDVMIRKEGEQLNRRDRLSVLTMVQPASAPAFWTNSKRSSQTVKS